jgi:hypothetical protein
VKSPQNRAVPRHYPTQQHPAAPKQMQEQDGFNKEKNGTRTLASWLFPEVGSTLYPKVPMPSDFSAQL